MTIARLTTFLFCAIPASAWGMTRWVIGWILQDDNYREDRHRFENVFGLNSDHPDMVEAWSRDLWKWVRVGPLWLPWLLLHNLKNITTEWTRLDAQRASKFFSFQICLAWAIAIVGFVT